jgi:hypothetical protein
MKDINELSNTDAAAALNKSFDESGISFKDRASALASFKANHHITVAEDGQLMTSFNGVRQSLASALGLYGRTSEGEEYTDRRSLPKSEQHAGGVRSRAELTTVAEKNAFISRFGIEKFESLPSRYMPESEVKTKQDFYKLTVSQKSALIRQNPNILSELPSQAEADIHGMTVIPGGRVNRPALAKDRATRPNQR